MKTNILFLSLFLLLINSKTIFSQIIPNGDFENWQPSLIFTYDPVGWTTDNQEVAPARVVPDSLAYSNELAMRVIAQPIPQGLHGEASIIIPITGAVPEQLSFYAKWERTMTASVYVEVIFYTANQEMVYSVTWSPEEEESDWALIDLDLLTVLPEAPPINEIKILVVSTVGDFAPGEGWVSVDAMEFTTPTAISNIDISNSLNVYPNPSNQEIQVSFEASLMNSAYQIIDLQGKVVQEGSLSTTINTASLSSGQYILNVNNGGQLYQEKIVVKRK